MFVTIRLEFPLLLPLSICLLPVTNDVLYECFSPVLINDDDDDDADNNNNSNNDNNNNNNNDNNN